MKKVNPVALDIDLGYFTLFKKFAMFEGKYRVFKEGYNVADL